MKKKLNLIRALFLLFFTIFLCQCSNKAKVFEAINFGKKSEDTGPTFTQESMVPEDLLAIFSKIPISLFDKTVSPITEKERDNLIEDQDSYKWVFSQNVDHKLELFSKEPGSTVNIYKLKETSNKTTVLSYIANEKDNFIDVWQEKDDSNLEKVNLLPSVKASDFFSQENQFEGIENLNKFIAYHIDSSGDGTEIILQLNTRLVEGFDGKRADNNLSLIWNGSSYELIKNGE